MPNDAQTPLVDAEARLRIREDLDHTFFVEAAAGTGKTRALIERIVHVLASGAADLRDVVAVTFTEKAAGEMKLRLRGEIERVRVARPNPSLDQALAQLELARVGTIHAFCADLLRERPVEAGIDPLFRVAAEDESQRILDQAFDNWFQRVLEDPPPGVRRVLRRRSRSHRAESARDTLRGAAGVLADHRDFDAAWQRAPFDRNAAIDHLLEALQEVGSLAEKASWSDDYLAQSIAEIDRFVAETRLREDVRGRDYDSLEAELRDLARSRSWRWRGSPRRPYGKGLPRPDVIALRDGAKRELDAFLAAADADLAPLLQQELLPVVAEYENLKRSRGCLDFLDLLVGARDLLRDSAEVRGEMQSRFSRYFVDEFQDTDPLQAEILLLLSADDPGEAEWTAVSPVAGKLFFVGDPKQAIYRFRRADVAIYQQVKQQLVSRGAEVLHLRTSFRSVAAIQQAVNASFAPVMTGGTAGGQPEYVALEENRPTPADRPAVVALPVPEPYAEWGKVTNRSIEESYPAAVGAFIDWLVRKSGWTVEEGGVAVPLQPRHVCILFRRFKRFRDDVTREYVRALEVRQIAHVLVGGRSFHDREEVLALRNALAAIEWPEDELRVYATLRGPFFALGDDALLAFRGQLGRLHPLRKWGELEGEHGAVAEALAVLAELHFARNRRPIADTISRLLAAVRAHAGVAIWPTGEQALANCMRIVDLARRFESGGATSFRAFVDRLEGDAERGVAEEAPAVEEGTEGVRVMTVHRAKGLEFPVVVLADPTCGLYRGTASRYVDPARGLWAEPLCGCAPRELLDAAEEEAERDREEGLRIAYVAATRARDLLVVPVVGDPSPEDEKEGWLSVLGPALYPESESRRSAAAAAACPAFGVDSVVDRPMRSGVEVEDAVAPGLHRPQAGDHEVVWWDPSILDLDREENVGLRQQSILEADREGVAVKSGNQAWVEWRDRREDLIRRGGVAGFSPCPVTALAEDESRSGPSFAVELAEVDVVRDQRRGSEFGTLVHGVLATVNLDAERPAIEAMSRVQARILGLDPDCAEAAAERVFAALQHPLMRRAASCNGAHLRRESPILIQLEDGVLAEGIVDLAFYEPGVEWTVVDFKTDANLGTALPLYRKQVAYYCEAIARASGAAATGVLLWL